MMKQSDSSLILKQKQAFRKRLTDLGFKTYDEYLESKHWNGFRAKWYRKFGAFKCSACGDTEEVCLHHWTYERLGNERFQDVYPLCRIDHDRVHAWCEEKEILLDRHDQIFGVLFSVDPPPWVKETPKAITQQLKTETSNFAERHGKIRAYQCSECKLIYRTTPTANQVTPCCGACPRRINNDAAVDCEFVKPSQKITAKQVAFKQPKPKEKKEKTYKPGRCELCGIPVQHKGLRRCCKCFNKKFAVKPARREEEPKPTRFDLAMKAKRRQWQAKLKAKQAADLKDGIKQHERKETN